MKDDLTNTGTKLLYQWLAYFVFIAALLPASFYAIKHPSYNWDMLGYMALVLKIEQKDFRQVHQVVYTSAKENTASFQYRLLGRGLSDDVT